MSFDDLSLYMKYCEFYDEEPSYRGLIQFQKEREDKCRV